MKKIEFQRFDKNLPFFKDSMPEDYVPQEPSEAEKERIDKICRWLFPELYENEK